MADNDGRQAAQEDEVVYLDEDGGPDDVASALEAAERAVAVVQERHRVVPPQPVRPDAEPVDAVGAEAEAAPGSVAEDVSAVLRRTGPFLAAPREP